MDTEFEADLKMEADIVHIKSRHSQALYPHSFSPPPMIVDVIQHVVSNSPLPYHKVKSQSPTNSICMQVTLSLC